MTKKWGYRPQDRIRIPVLDALESGRTPRPIKGQKKPLLVPGHPDFYDQMPDSDAVADALERWARDWDTDWVIVDTHPGISPAAHGALQVAHAVVVPTPLRILEMNALEELVDDMADYPVIVSPSMVPPTPPAKPFARLREIVDGTQVQVSPPIPLSTPVATRTRRTAMCADTTPGKRLQPVVEAFEMTAKFLRQYVDSQE